MSSTAAFLRLVGLLLSLALPSLAFGSEAEFIGHWEGTMVRDGVPLEVSFDFRASGPHPSGTSVSYTHLDVYKRQALRRNIIVPS